jgi:xanthine dehydrogenase small subunit
VPPEDQFFATYKVCKRFEQDISAVCAAFSLQIDNGEVRNARICYGGMAGIPKRAANCERALNGQQWNQQTINQGMQAMHEDFTPITDMRASAQYRMQVAQNLLQRFFLEHTATLYPVRLGLRFNQAPLDKDVADV